MKKQYTKEQILNFSPQDWKFERSSGYFGYRNINQCGDEYDIWIYEEIKFKDSYQARKILKEKYIEDYKLLSSFICAKMPGISSDVIEDYLDKEYFI